MYRKFRSRKKLDDSVREDFIYAFTKGEWRHVIEYGDRDGSEEPCVMSKNPLEPIHGLLPYQAAYWLFYGKVPPKGKCISHRCRNQKNTTSTRCCNPMHMLIRSQKENRSRTDDHKAIIQKANSLKQTQPGPLRGAVKIGDDCKHKGPDGKECCIISYGENESATDSVPKYVLRHSDWWR